MLYIVHSIAYARHHECTIVLHAACLIHHMTHGMRCIPHYMNMQSKHITDTVCVVCYMWWAVQYALYDIWHTVNIFVRFSFAAYSWLLYIRVYVIWYIMCYVLFVLSVSHLMPPTVGWYTTECIRFYMVYVVYFRLTIWLCELCYVHSSVWATICIVKYRIEHFTRHMLYIIQCTLRTVRYALYVLPCIVLCHFLWHSMVLQ